MHHLVLVTTLVVPARAILDRGGIAADRVAAYPSYQELYFSQALDHFNPESHARWSHRYLLNNESWDGRGKLANGCRGPILMYTGNEGPIDAFWGSNGFMIEVLAPKFGALLLFPEERFYGKSMPFGKESLTADHLRYLTTAQVLEDMVDLVAHLKASLPGAANCPVVAFGGSYGATLTALLRASHPATIIGGLAASSELGYYDVAGWESHGVTEFAFENVVARDFASAHPQCMPAIQAAKKLIEDTEDAELVKTFHTCDATALGQNKSDFFTYALEGLPQQDYPYAIGSMPANPVNYSCNLLVKSMDNPKALLAAAGSISDLAQGYDGSSCIPYNVGGPGNTPGDGPGLNSWGWQSCTETLHAFSAHTIRDYTFKYKSSRRLCSELYNQTVFPDLYELARQFGGGYALAEGKAGVQNLIWSQGTLDPWHGWWRNIAQPPAGSNIHHFLMEGSAHHLDLKSPHPSDPPSVTAARAQYVEIIYKWIQESSGNSPEEIIV